MLCLSDKNDDDDKPKGLLSNKYLMSAFAVHVSGTRSQPFVVENVIPATGGDDGKIGFFTNRNHLIVPS